MRQLIILVEGGMVQGVWSDMDHSELNVVLVDQDNIRLGDPHPFGTDDEMEKAIQLLKQVL